jgi:ABC-type Fe3+/spermidine/putrescine transport system ATPase subunit
MIRAEGLGLLFGEFLMEGIDLSVEPGESFFLLGPSGAGKTLLLEGLLGIKKPRSGKVYLADQEVTLLPPEKRQVAYVPQDLALFPHLSVRENLLFGLKLRRRMPSDAISRLEYWVDILDLAEVLDRKDVKTLSGGEQQRVALARALITNPQILFMDEPFSALDASLRRRLQLEFRRMQKDIGLTVIQVTHDPEEAFLMADRIAILINGCIEQVGSPTQIYNRPVNLNVARFLMLQNLYPGRVGGIDGQGWMRVEVAGTTFLVENDERYQEGNQLVLGVRPEEVILIRPDLDPRPEGRPNFMRGEVTGWVDLGHYRLLRLKIDSLELDCWLNIRAAREYPMTIGDLLYFHIRPKSFCLIHED